MLEGTPSLRSGTNYLKLVRAVVYYNQLNIIRIHENLVIKIGREMIELDE
jgi:hypothetical protein